MIVQRIYYKLIKPYWTSFGTNWCIMRLSTIMLQHQSICDAFWFIFSLISSPGASDAKPLWHLKPIVDYEGTTRSTHSILQGPHILSVNTKWYMYGLGPEFLYAYMGVDINIASHIQHTEATVFLYCKFLVSWSLLHKFINDKIFMHCPCFHSLLWGNKLYTSCLAVYLRWKQFEIH